MQASVQSLNEQTLARDVWNLSDLTLPDHAGALTHNLFHIALALCGFYLCYPNNLRPSRWTILSTFFTFALLLHSCSASLSTMHVISC